MCFTERVRQAADPIWQAYFTHPFVTGIGDGSLSVEKFRFFLLQDYLYLYDYAKVFALGLLKSGIPEEMRFFSSNVGRRPERRDEHPPGLHEAAGDLRRGSRIGQNVAGQPRLHQLYAFR